MARHHRDMSSSGRSGLYLLFCVLALVLFATRATTAAETHYHDFVVQQTPVKRLCSSRNIITVNGMFPGPTLKVNNGDTLVINVVNRMQYNVTIHWHGVRQMRTAWADGPEFITQCPIRPGGSYTYRFTIQGQEGTLWWHAHSSWLRATVYGAIVIYPNPESSSYPFEKPNKEFPVILGEWWNANPVDVIREALRTGAAPNVSDAYTINGQPGDLYNCSTKETTVFPVTSGDIVLLRVINAALNQELFFSVAAHKMTVVAADASYLKPFTTNVLMLGPGETMDVIITADQPSARYYLAAHAYDSTTNAPFDNTTTTAILQYKGSGCAAPNSGGKKAAALPQLPAFNDTNTVTDFFAKFKSLRTVQVPDPVDEELFFTVGLGLLNCTPGSNCGGPNNTRFAASMNNHSFVLPTTVSILQAHLQGVPGIFNPNFPPVPPLKFDYTAQNVPRRLWSPVKGTEVLKLKYGTTIQLVIQGTTIFSPENHPMHIHGYDFYILATGFGNFNPATDIAKFNLHDPPMKNTVAVPTAGWAAIRFVADNPGAWFMHCHLDVHLAWGLAMVFVVEDGVGELQKLEAPPADLPAC